MLMKCRSTFGELKKWVTQSLSKVCTCDSGLGSGARNCRRRRSGRCSVCSSRAELHVWEGHLHMEPAHNRHNRASSNPVAWSSSLKDLQGLRLVVFCLMNSSARTAKLQEQDLIVSPLIARSCSMMIPPSCLAPAV